ncbi:MAG: outer membrane beta-barrel domain-containing protein [Myxococcota bacterium]
MSRYILRALFLGLATVAAAAPISVLGGPQAAAAAPTPTTPTPPGPDAPDDNTDEPDENEPTKTDLESLIRIVQQRPILKAGRFELFAGAGIVGGDQMYKHWLATATGRVHVSEWVSIGASYEKYWSKESSLLKDVTQDFEVFPERSRMQWYAGGEVSVVAMEGKFSVFDATIAYWDLYASIGGGVIATSRSTDPKPAGLIGVGLRLFLTDWLTMSFELRDHIFFEKFNAGNEFMNDVVGQVGLTLFIPFGFDYEYEK